MRAIDKLIAYLTKRFNDDGEIFKVIVGDKDSVPIDPIVTSADFNQGAIANELEWMSSMITQLNASSDINNLSELELPFWEELVGLIQASHENVQQFVDRVLGIMADEKQTAYGITQAMLRYTDLVGVQEIYSEGAFADTTFADHYATSLAPVVTSAFAASSQLALNVLQIIIVLGINERLENPAVRRTIISVLDEVVLPGVHYEIQLV
jgi:hypothetical protein